MSATDPTIRWMRHESGALRLYKHNHNLYSEEPASPKDEIVVLKAVVTLGRKWIVAVPIDRSVITEPDGRFDLDRLDQEAVYAARLQEKKILAGETEK